MSDDIVDDLKRYAEMSSYPGTMLDAADEVTTLRAEVEKLRAALEYYAGRHNYIGRIDQLDGKAYPSAVIVDNGDIARAALGEDKKMLLETRDED